MIASPFGLDTSRSCAELMTAVCHPGEMVETLTRNMFIRKPVRFNEFLLPADGALAANGAYMCRDHGLEIIQVVTNIGVHPPTGLIVFKTTLKASVFGRQGGVALQVNSHRILLLQGFQPFNPSVHPHMRARVIREFPTDHTLVEIMALAAAYSDKLRPLIKSMVHTHSVSLGGVHADGRPWVPQEVLCGTSRRMP